jgi:uncharacterized protein (TIGR03437 family)
MRTKNRNLSANFICGLLCGLALFAGGLSAEPLIFFRAIVNSASFMPADGPGGAIARGSIFTLFGRDIGPLAGAQVSSFPLGTTFEGVSIEVAQGDVTVNAIPIFVSSGQLGAIMPSNAPLGRVSVRLTFDGEQSNATPVTIVENSVGIFTATVSGIGPGIIQNFVSQTAQPFNTPSGAARPGQVVTMWATGLGPITGPDGAAPPVGSLPFDVEIFVGGKTVTKLLYAGRAPCCSGVDQFVFETPADSPEGCYVPVQARVGGSAVSNTVTMAIQKDGDACSEPDNPFMQTFLGGGAIGAITLERTLFESDVDVLSPSTFTVDQAAGYFRQETGGVFAFNPFFALPPAGACTAYSRSGNLLAGIPIPFVPTAGLDAGELSLNGPNGAAELLRTVTADSTDYDPTVVGGPEGISDTQDAPLYLSPGNYGVAGEGGADIGAINADADVSDAPQWTNSGDFTEVSRGDDVTFTWTAPGAARVVVAGVSVDRPSNASGMFLCLAPAGSTSLRVPAAVLANLPASRSILGQSDGFLILGSWPTGALESFTADGLDQAAVMFQSIHSKTVRFR